MFLGARLLAVDDKGRVPLAAKQWDALGASAYFTSDVDGCLSVWSREEFRGRAQEMRHVLRTGSPEERDMARAFFAGAEEALPDGKRRIMIPPGLRNFAGIRSPGEVYLVGAFDHLEVWNAARWRRHEEIGRAALAGGGAEGKDEESANAAGDEGR